MMNGQASQWIQAHDRLSTYRPREVVMRTVSVFNNVTLGGLFPGNMGIAF